MEEDAPAPKKLRTDEDDAWRQSWPFLPFCDATVLKKCKAYEASNDIFICSFPKSGTTWMQNAVYTLLTRGTDRSFSQISDVAAFFEHRRTWASGDDGGPPALAQAIVERTAHMPRRVFNTHLLWHMLPTESPDARFIYVVRQGEDAMVSFFHHLSNQCEGTFEGDFPTFFQQSLDGTVAFGRWTDHLTTFFPVLAAGDPRVLCVTYEDMKVNLAGVLLRVGKHLGLGLGAEDLEPLLGLLSFEAMQGTPQFQPTSVTWKEGFRFVRKGTVGDYQNHFAGDMEQRFLDHVRQSRVFDTFDPWASACEGVKGFGAKYR